MTTCPVCACSLPPDALPPASCPVCGAVVPAPDPADGGLPPVRHRGNWSLRRLKLPQLLVKRLPDLDHVADRLAVVLADKTPDGTVIGSAPEHPDQPGTVRTLRVRREVAPGHTVHVDLTLRAEKTDLLLKTEARPRTRIARLRYALYLGVWSAVTLAAFLVYWWATGSRQAWAVDYAQKLSRLHHQDQEKSSFYTNRILRGCYVLDCARFREALETPEAGAEFEAFLDAAMDVRFKRARAAAKARAARPRPFDGMESGFVRRFAEELGSPDVALGMYLGFAGPPRNRQEKKAAIAMAFGASMGMLGSQSHADEVTIWLLMYDPPASVVWHDLIQGWVGQQGTDSVVALEDHSLYRTAYVNQGLMPATPYTTFRPLLRVEYLADRDPSEPLAVWLAEVKELRPDLYDRIDSARRAATRWEPAWSVLRLWRASPGLGMTHAGLPLAIVGMIVGTVIGLTGRWMLREACRLFGWPTPDQFDEEATLHAGRVRDAFCELLFEEFGKTQADIVVLTD